jgi:hypothetical protein
MRVLGSSFPEHRGAAAVASWAFPDFPPETGRQRDGASAWSAAGRVGRGRERPSGDPPRVRPKGASVARVAPALAVSASMSQRLRVCLRTLVGQAPKPASRNRGGRMRSRDHDSLLGLWILPDLWTRRRAHRSLGKRRWIAKAFPTGPTRPSSSCSESEARLHRPGQVRQDDATIGMRADILRHVPFVCGDKPPTFLRASIH